MRWGELFYNIFAILCIAGESFLVWYEISGLSASPSVADAVMRILLGVARKALSHTVAFCGCRSGASNLGNTEVRDVVMMTWETFAARREERGRRKERREILHKINQLLPSENGASVHEETDDLETLIARIIENPDALKKLRVMLREMQDSE